MIVLEIPKSPILQMCYQCFNLAHYIISATHSMCSAKAVSHPESCQNMQVGRLKYSHSSINIFRFFEMEKASKCYEVTMEEKNAGSQTQDICDLAASALLQNNSQVTPKPHNSVYVLQTSYLTSQLHTWQPLSMCHQNSIRG